LDVEAKQLQLNTNIIEYDLIKGVNEMGLSRERSVTIMREHVGECVDIW